MSASLEHYDVWVYLLVATVVYASVLVPCQMQVWITAVSMFELFCYIFQQAFASHDTFVTHITLFGAAVGVGAVTAFCGTCIVCYLAACRNKPAVLLAFSFNTGVSSLFLVASIFAFDESDEETNDVIGTRFTHALEVVVLVLVVLVRCGLGWLMSRVSPKCRYHYDDYAPLADDDDG